MGIFYDINIIYYYMLYIMHTEKHKDIAKLFQVIL